MTTAEILKRAAALKKPRAIEAYWDGDTDGWFIVLAAVGEGELGVLSRGSDYRLFVGAVPPWPEAVLAREVGEQIAAQFGVPFWFPAADWPEDDAARYDDRERAVPCAGCALPLVQEERCPWRGVCYQCHLAERK